MLDRSKSSLRFFRLDVRITTSPSKTIHVKKPKNGCQMKEEWASVIKEVKILRGSQSQGLSTFRLYHYYLSSTSLIKEISGKRIPIIYSIYCSNKTILRPRSNAVNHISEGVLNSFDRQVKI
jgi:hypothetical protein